MKWEIDTKTKHLSLNGNFRRSLSGVWNEKCNGGVILMSVSNLFRTPDDFINDLISHKEPVDA